MVLLLAVCALAQPPAKPLEFEVASIRLNNTASPTPRSSISAGKLNADSVTLRVLIQEAYGLLPFQLSGGPRWLDSDRFRVMAQGDPSATNAQVKQMLQSLLAERFRLSVRVETKEQPIYALQVRDRSKLKFRPSPEGSRGGLNISTGGTADPAITYKFIAYTMPQLADQLSRETQRIVKDETGLDGAFDFELNAVREPEEKNPFAAPLAPIISELGLRLESRRGPVEFYIVDRAEQPSEN